MTNDCKQISRCQENATQMELIIVHRAKENDIKSFMITNWRQKELIHNFKPQVFLTMPHGIVTI